MAKVNHQGTSTFVLFDAVVGLSVRNRKFPRGYLSSEWSRFVKAGANAESEVCIERACYG